MAVSESIAHVEDVITTLQSPAMPLKRFFSHCPFLYEWVKIISKN